MNAPQSVSEMSPAELARRLASGERLVLVDVREPIERRYCAIPVHSAVVDLFVPVGAVPDEVHSLRKAAESAPTIIYCHHGVRSRMVADWLSAQGVPNLINLTGGIDAWADQLDREMRRY